MRNSKSIELVLFHIDFIARNRWIIIISFMALVLPMLIKLLFFFTPYYMASAQILPPSKSGGLSSPEIAGTAVLKVLTGGIGSSSQPALYVDIIKSRLLAYKILQTKFKLKEADTGQNLLTLLNISSNNQREALEIGYRILTEDLLTVKRNLVNGIITVIVETPDPQLSVDVVNVYIEELDTFLAKINSLRASEEREFISLRIKDTEEILNQAEINLRDFRESNKRIEKSPDLQLEQARLIREIKVQEEIFINLKSRYEIAKIEEVKNLSTISLLDEPIPATQKSRPARVKIMLTTSIIALILGISLIYSYDYFNRLRGVPKYHTWFLTILEYFKQDMERMMRIWVKTKPSESQPEDHDSNVNDNE